MLPIVARLASSRDNSVKYVWKLADNQTVESVFLAFDGHDSLCVSSQVGCHMACSFCATGLDGLKRNLSASEIVAQVDGVIEDRGLPSRQFEISFMGMGEPLLNLKAVVEAITELKSRPYDLLFSLSTVGIVPKIYELAEMDINLLLQISLHAANDKLRSVLIPINSKYPIAEVLKAANHHASVKGNSLYFNYLLMDGVNDSDDAAHELVALLKDLPAYVKISRLNPISEIDLSPASNSRHERFEAICSEGGLNRYHFGSMGVDIEGGCGQLRTQVASSVSANQELF